MSRAFVKETAPSAPPPERMVEDGPNLVTPEGLAQIEAHVARIEAAMADEANPLLRETMARDLRYWVHQRATAEVVAPRSPSENVAPPSPGPSSTDRPLPSREREVIAFGSRVVVARKGREQRFRIVGVDEADPAQGLISFRSPLAAAIIGARVGDIVEAAEPLGEIEIVAVD